MDNVSEQSVDSLSRHSYLGSYYDPPETKRSSDLHQEASAAVVAALKTLQEKMRRLEMDKLQRDSPERDESIHTRDALAAALDCAEKRCSWLEEQLLYMKSVMERETETRVQLSKLERLEEQYQSLTRSQTAAQHKIQCLEEKLLEEERQRRIVQEKLEEGELRQHADRSRRDPTRGFSCVHASRRHSLTRSLQCTADHARQKARKPQQRPLRPATPSPRLCRHDITWDT